MNIDGTINVNLRIIFIVQNLEMQCNRMQILDQSSYCELVM